MAKRALKRIISLKVLPGEPLDGTGRVCIHLFVPDGGGSFVEPHVLRVNGDGKIVAGPARGRLACDPRLTVDQVTVKNVTTIVQRTDDPRATTCHKCVASDDYRRIMATEKK